MPPSLPNPDSKKPPKGELGSNLLYVLVHTARGIASLQVYTDEFPSNKPGFTYVAKKSDITIEVENKGGNKKYLRIKIKDEVVFEGQSNIMNFIHRSEKKIQDHIDSIDSNILVIDFGGLYLHDDENKLLIFGVALSDHIQSGETYIKNTTPIRDKIHQLLKVQK